MSNLNELLEGDLSVSGKLQIDLQPGEVIEPFMVDGYPPVDKEAMQTDYKLHPTQTFKGLHDNFLLGLFGSVDIYTPYEMTAQNLLKDFKIK